MLSKLLPKETSFFDFFDRHVDVLSQAIRAFADMCQPGADKTAFAKRIKDLEHQADAITHQCVEQLHSTFITPFDRFDIHRLIVRMDDVLDHVDAAAERMMLYELDEVLPEVRGLADVLLRCTVAMNEGVRGLRDMKNAMPIFAACRTLNTLENEADALLRTAIARLFKQEKDPIVIIKWKEICETLETATDKAEDVAKVLEGVVLEHA